MSEGFSIQLKDVFEFKNEGIFSKVLSKSETYNYSIMCLAKGSDIDTHTSTKNGGVYVLQGKGIFNLEGKDIVLAPGVFIFMPANAKHSLRADEDLAILLCLSV